MSITGESGNSQVRVSKKPLCSEDSYPEAWEVSFVKLHAVTGNCNVRHNPIKNK